MKKPVLAIGMASVGLLQSCSSLPTTAAPNLSNQVILMQFAFPEGSTCFVDTSAGRLSPPAVPGTVRFNLSDKMGASGCTLPDGSVYRITTQNQLPDDTTGGVSAVVVAPGGAHTTIDQRGALVRQDLDSTVQRIK